MANTLFDPPPALSVAERAKLRMHAARAGHPDVARWDDAALVAWRDSGGKPPKPQPSRGAVLRRAATPEEWAADPTGPRWRPIEPDPDPEPEPEPAPAPAPAPALTAARQDAQASRSVADAAAALAAALAAAQPTQTVDEAAVRRIVDEAIASATLPRRLDLVVTQPDRDPITVEGAHPAAGWIAQALDALAAVGMGCMLTGPAGSGKSTAAIHAAEALGRACYVQPGAGLVDPVQLTGFRDAHGNVAETPLIRAMREGAVYVLDEFDATLPTVQLSLNAVIAQRRAMTPDGEVHAAPGFAVVAAANTIGQGGNARYRGRYAQDAAALDRYAVRACGYDDELEARLAGDAAIVAEVQRIRGAVDRLQLDYVVGMRASIGAAALVRAGLPRDEALAAVIWSKVAEQDQRAIRGAL